MKMPKTFFMLLFASVMIFVLTACGPTANAPASGAGAPTSGTDVSSAAPSQAPAPDNSSTEPTLEPEPEPEPEPGIQDLPGAWTPVRDTAPDGWEICYEGHKHEIMESYDFYVGPDMPKNDRNVVSYTTAWDDREMISYNNYVSSPLFYFMIIPSDDVEKLYDRRLDHPLGKVGDYGTNWILDKELDGNWLYYHIWIYDSRVGEIHMLMNSYYGMGVDEKLDTDKRDRIIQKMENFVIVPTE